MLKLTIPATEAWDSIKEEFITVKETKLVLEHSLLSISKWESKWKIPYLSHDKKTDEMALDYVRCMCVNKVEDDNAFRMISSAQYKVIEKYINDPMSASEFFDNEKRGRKNQKIPSEQIYCWMTMYRIPFETERWHLNRLLALIKWCSIENAPKEKMSRQEILSRNAKLNAQRKAKYKTKG